MDFNDYIRHDDFDFENLRKDMDKLWKKQGLKDFYLRRHYQDMMTKEQQDKMIWKAMQTKNNKKFLKYINTGLILDKDAFAESNESNPNDYIPSLLNQAIILQDTVRIGMLLSAGAPVTIEAECPFIDALYYTLATENPSILAMILAYTDKPISKHWAFGALQSFYANGSESAILMGQLIGFKLSQQGVDLDKYMTESRDYYVERIKRAESIIQEEKTQQAR